jgi:uncharacterized protein YbbK (DUF523 family)
MTLQGGEISYRYILWEKDMFMEKIRLGISTCLLGENVRFDGGHKWDRFLTDTLGQYVEYVPICPEVECGFGGQ